MELWDIYDGDRRFLGRTRERGKWLTEGEFHIVVGAWILNRNGKILLTLRHPEKETYPNMWENTGGAVQSGEDSLSAIIREIWEETGIRASEDELKLVGTVKGKRNFVDVYVLYKDMGDEPIRLQAGETADYRWVRLEELDKMAKSGALADPIAQRFQAFSETLREIVNSLTSPIDNSGQSV